MKKQSLPIGEQIVKKYDRRKSEHGVWEGHWNEVTQYFIPRKDNVYNARPAGDKRNDLIYDSTPMHAAELLASALHGMLTNPTSQWFGLSTGNPEIDRDDDVKAWMQDSSMRMIQVLNNSNFQSEIHEVYLDLVTMGTSTILIEEDEEEIVRCTSRPIHGCIVFENHKNKIDTVYYEYELELQQIVELWGDKLPQDFLDKAMQNPEAKEKIIHAVEPRKKYDTDSISPTRMKFASYRVLRCLNLLLEEKGFREMPYAVPRWSKLSGETFGRSPAMKCLPDAQMLNKMKKATIEAAQLVVSPTLQVPDDGVLLPIKTRPGSINYYRAGTKDRIEPLNTGANIGLGEDMMQTVRTQIMQAFYIDQLQLANNNRMTTVEVNQRRDEQLRLLSPILGRLHNELLKPLVDRVFSVMLRKKQFLTPPEALAGAALEIKYTSMLAKAHLAAEGDNFQRFLGMVAPVLQMQPDISDKINGDEVIEYAASIYGVPHLVLNKKSEVAKIRKGKMEAAQKMEAREDESHEASIAESEAKTGPEEMI